MIDGVIVTPLKKILDNRGSVMHMLRSDSPVFKKFGEIYFSTINSNFVKAWHKHKENTLNYACIKGRVKFVLFDDRKESKTFGKVEELYLSPVNYFLVTVPPMIWNGFMGVENEVSIVANCMTGPHNENEMIRKDILDKHFPYDWNKKEQY
jgi:dTDP-4-dehydrorhamnose 3,5-epimerase